MKYLQYYNLLRKKKTIARSKNRIPFFTFLTAISFDNKKYDIFLVFLFKKVYLLRLKQFVFRFEQQR